MASLCSWTLLLLTSIVHLSAGGSTKFLLTVPKEPHYDTEFTVTVTAINVVPGQRSDVTLEYRGYRDKSRLLNFTNLEFDSDAVKSWKVVFPWERMQEIDEPGVHLTMLHGWNQESTDLLFTQATGYIFIQTDKPVYTPQQTVKFRVIAVNEYQQLAKYQLKVDIRNDKQIIVDRMRYSAEDAFKAQEFELPRETPPGVWSITANFEGLDNSIGSTHTVKFEVKEYVLPRFSATLNIDTDVITRETEWITATVEAKYVYGRPVFGTAEMQLGTWDSVSGIQLFPKHYVQELKDGKFKKDIRVGNLFPSNKPFPLNKRLYVNVNVTESATLENDTLEDTSTFLAHPYYVVKFDKAKKYFRPGFPYTLKARVTAQSGTPASWVWLIIYTTYDSRAGKIGRTHQQYQRLNENGEVSVDFDIPPEAVRTSFLTIVFDLKKTTYERYTHHVIKLVSPNNEYIHIAMESPIKKYRDGVVVLRYTRNVRGTYRSAAEHNKITVLVLAKGHVIYSTSTIRNADGRSVVKIPRTLYSEASPAIRIVAYYYVEGAKPEFVTDSLKVETPHVCLEELHLLPPGGIHALASLYKPKDRYSLDVEGAPYMNVGFAAVDNAVLLINDKQTLTRDLMFEQLGSHDQGVVSGDGNNMREIFRNSGLTYLLLDTTELERPIYDPLREGMRRYPEPPRGGMHDLSFGSVGPMGSVWEARPSPTLPVRKEELGVRLVTVAPPQTVRKYFPESWFFEERKLPRSGNMVLNLTLPDSITTWSFLAVGVSTNRGVCVSRPLTQQVHKLFFADVRLPYKVTRLEEVKVKIAVYNYQVYALVINVVVSGSEGICFSANTARGASQNSTSFSLKIGPGQVAGETVKIIPLKNGDLTLRVDLQNQHERDVVERKLHVVAEGQRIRKSVTFVLDPEAKHATFKPVKKQKIVLANTATVDNLFDVEKKEQQTKIDLALPQEVIRGTEFCRIAAFGDLMGDIITHAVVQSKSLIDQKVLNAEEVLGDLSPTVYALLYANSTGLMDAELRERGRRFVRHGIMRLLKYKRERYFVLDGKSKPATWLTAFALKTLCRASSLAYVDRSNLIDRGFDWLLDQTTENGTVEEQDWRLAKDSFEYSVMLSADVLIALQECDKSELESHLTLQFSLFDNLESNLKEIKEPMVLAKVAYALQNFDPEAESTREAVARLARIRRRNKLGQFYWSDERETDEARRTPHWYHDGAKASSIEATAYALLVFTHGPYRGINVDSIADWLVAQRNHNGAFIGAMDSSIAIYALSEYSELKHGLEIDLNCNVTSDKLKDILHTFKFTEKNATKQESLSNVPVGQTLEVVTRGQGLGQMQVKVEYNVPLDENRNCPFQLVVNVSKTSLKWSPDMYSNPLCAYCDIGCVKEENTTMNETEVAKTEPVLGAENHQARARGVVVGVANPARQKLPRQRVRQRPVGPQVKRPTGTRKRLNRRGGRKQFPRRVPRGKRSIPAASKKSICLHICLQPTEQKVYGPVDLEIEMLTGYRPVPGDIERIKENPNVRSAEFVPQTEMLNVRLLQVSAIEQTCIALRAVDEEEVGRRTPATVKVSEIGRPNPTCVVDYYPVSGEESLQVYCADFSHINRGECRCYSGLCSYCSSSGSNALSFHTIKQEACKASVAYQLLLSDVESKDQWLEIDAKVLTLNKTGDHEIRSGDNIKMITPSSCICPVYSFGGRRREPFYMLSADVEKMVDRNGRKVYQYLLDEQSLFLKVVDDTQVSNSDRSAVPMSYLKHALSPRNKCPA